MEEKEKDFMLRSDLEMISLQLGSLTNMINTIHNGLEGEHMEVQAVDCVDCIGFCVGGIKRMVDDCLEQLEKNLKNCNDIERA